MRNFSTEDDAIVWIIDNQMGRRNIESAAKIRLALKKEGIRTRQAENRMKSGGYEYKGSVKHPSADLREGKGKATEFIAQDAGVSARSVEQFKYIEKNSPNLADDLCAGKKINNKKLSLDECFDDETDVRIWIIDHQDGRRELEPYVRAELQMEKSVLQKRKRNNQHTKGQAVECKEDAAPHQYGEVDNSKPYKRLAKKAGVSPRTYSMACYIAKNAPEDVKEKLRKGESAIKTEYKKLKKEEKRQEMSSHI